MVTKRVKSGDNVNSIKFDKLYAQLFKVLRRKLSWRVV